MSTKVKQRTGRWEFYDANTSATTLPVTPVVFRHQFFGNAIDPLWTVLDVSVLGNAAPGLVDGVGGGAVAINLDSQAEEQDSGIYFNDVRPFDVKANLVCEFRVRATVVMGTGVRCVFGLAAAHNLVKDDVATAAWFSMTASAVLSAQTDDTSNDESATTGTTMGTGTWYICRVDFTTLADVTFWIDGTQVATGTTFDMSNLTAGEAMMQPYAMIDKASGGDLGTLQISDITIWSDETA